jgi:tetratricopeptide (TPR) repeat protein
MQDTYESWSRTYPRDDIPRNNLGLYFSEIGEWERALLAYQDAMRLAPTEYVSYGNTAEALRVLGRFDEARATLEQMLARIGDNYRAYVWLYETALAKGDRAALPQYAAKVKGTAGEMQLASLQAREAAAAGRLREHRQLLEQMTQISDRRGLREFSSVEHAYSAACEAEYGYPSLARQGAAAALSQARNWGTQTMAASALARAKDVAGAERILRELGKETHPRTTEQVLSLATAEAALALARGEPQKAVAMLEPLIRLDLTYGGPRAMYLRGIAHLANGNARQAVDVFNKLQKYRWLEAPDLWHTLVHLGSARALAQAGDVSGAKQSYEKFFAILKDADPGIPLLDAGKREYAAISAHPTQF